MAVGFDDGFVRRLVKPDQMAEIRIETLADDLDDFLRVGDGIVGLKGEQRLGDRFTAALLLHRLRHVLRQPEKACIAVHVPDLELGRQETVWLAVRVKGVFEERGRDIPGKSFAVVLHKLIGRCLVEYLCVGIADHLGDRIPARIAGERHIAVHIALGAGVLDGEQHRDVVEDDAEECVSTSALANQECPESEEDQKEPRVGAELVNVQDLVPFGEAGAVLGQEHIGILQAAFDGGIDVILVCEVIQTEDDVARHFLAVFRRSGFFLFGQHVVANLRRTIRRGKLRI